MFNPFKRKPNSVQYGEKKGKELAQPVFNEKTQSMELHIKGEEYALRGMPRHHFLHGPLAPLKGYMKNFVITAMVKCLPYKIPDDKLVEPVREFARVFDLLIEAEDEPEMKKLMGQFKDAMTMMLQEDDAWRFRFQWAMEKLDMKKIKLNKSDKYYFRGKSFKVDS